ERTLFSITNFPAVDKKFVDHPFTFCEILSTIKVNKSRFRLPKCSGVFREKVMEDLVRLISWPDASSYLLRITIKVLQQSFLILMKNIVSSAKRR
ncbi:hypothetical protein N665_5389s0001, partial [Sinapis alba]